MCVCVRRKYFELRFASFRLSFSFGFVDVDVVAVCT